MIQELRNITPFIHFGFGRIQLTVSVGDSLDVWLKTLYNRSAYSIDIKSALPKVKVSDYQYTITPAVAGTYEIQFEVNTPSKTTSLQSNIIILTVE